MERRMVAVLVATAVAAACGGGSGSTPAAPSTPATGGSGSPTKVAQLDASNFDTAVLAAASPALVEFHSPT